MFIKQNQKTQMPKIRKKYITELLKQNEIAQWVYTSNILSVLSMSE